MSFPSGTSVSPALRGPAAGQLPTIEPKPARSGHRTTAGTRAPRVAVITPCYNRRADAELLLQDLARLTHTDPKRPAPEIRVLLVDNASTDPLHTIAAPDGLDLHHLTLADNLGGSGGYNEGIRAALASDWPGASGELWEPDFLWLVDSDVRLAPDSLTPLLETLDTHPEAAGVGSAIIDPETGQCFEFAGRVHPEHGSFGPATPGCVGMPTVVQADYAAACSILVRAGAARAAGPMPDRFLHGDDVEWSLAVTRATGMPILADQRSRIMHPTFDRFPLWTRYYTTRNVFPALSAKRLPFMVVYKRAMREAIRAAQQEMVDRPDLARLHLLGLEHSITGPRVGPCPPIPEHGIKGRAQLGVTPFSPLTDLPGTIEQLRKNDPELDERFRTRRIRLRIHPNLRMQHNQQALALAHFDDADIDTSMAQPITLRRLLPSLLAAARRVVFGSSADIAIVPPRGRPENWFCARHVISITHNAFHAHTPRRIRVLPRALATFVRGWTLSVRLALRPGGDPGPSVAAAVRPDMEPARGRTDQTHGSLAVLVLSHNAADRLCETLRALESDAPDAEIIVADNGSTDGTLDRLAREFPRVRVLALGSNLGVEGFNRAALATRADYLLLLDDDALPEQGALAQALAHLDEHPQIGAVTLTPISPRGRSEWAWAPEGAVDDFPAMGCANLVRRHDYLRVGGYERSYFLYRNDADLAMKLLAVGRGVRHDPSLRAVHHTEAGPRAPKGVRWHETATRNWVWTARRHAHSRGALALGVAAQLLWALKLSGLSRRKLAATLRGAVGGLFTSPPGFFPEQVRGVQAQSPHRVETRAPDRSAFWRLVKMQTRSRRGR